ncbi:hypothetical protein JTE90_007819 [Oedothorax gibbosus]|uniref:Uncharacterized protein n=1 Tax=Oedothorax gibbosus TaxID=931172 RepID=A0AAV6VHC8_9ARAC|nr:hypothetical protein JTE90_007819 [Oedothorax gibbosus]
METVMTLFDEPKWDDNPCGFDEDEVDVAIPEDIIIKDILKSGKLLLSKVVESRKILVETSQEVDEHSLESQEYKFLKIEINVGTVFQDSYFVLQVCKRAIAVLINEIDKDAEKKYLNATKRARDQINTVLCYLQISLMGKEKYDLSKIQVPKSLLNLEKDDRHIRDAIFLRQIGENIRQIIDSFEKY